MQPRIKVWFIHIAYEN